MQQNHPHTAAGVSKYILTANHVLPQSQHCHLHPVFIGIKISLCFLYMKTASISALLAVFLSIRAIYAKSTVYRHLFP